jgi:predicted TIM-barrel fold metal-dependent hydrolase
MTFTVDVHHHVLPEFFWGATNEGDHPVGGITPPPWSKQAALSFLDDAGIDVALTSISTPGVHTGDKAAARTLARRCNEFCAELVRDHPDRYGGFACLPLPDVDNSLNVVPGAGGRASAADTFRRLYWDTALSWSDHVLEMLRAVVSIDQVLFGTDYPYLRRDLAVATREHIVETPVLTGDEKTSVLSGTALKLVPRLASLAAARVA